MIVAATPSVISRIVFFDKDLAESDIPFVESVIDPPVFPAFSLNFLAIPVRPSADPLKRSTSFECNSIRAFAGNLFSSTSIEAVEAADDADDAVVDAVIDAVVDDDDDINDNNDDDKDDADAVVDWFSLFVS